MKHLAEQISRGKMEELQAVELLVKIPRSWSRCGRCSGRSGGTLFTSGFLSTGGGSHCLRVLLCLGREGVAVKTEQYLCWAWLKGRWGAAVSLVSADAQTHKAALLCQQEISFLSFLLLKKL